MEDKIEIGEYVRVNNDNRNCIGIGKVTRLVKESVYVNMNNKYNLPVCFQINNIVKHSKQLIDLIEAGDYINGYKVINIIKNKINNNKLIAVGNMDYEFETVKELTETNGIKLLGNKDIQTILTKESYMANCYKVGGEDDN